MPSTPSTIKPLAQPFLSPEEYNAYLARSGIEMSLSTYMEVICIRYYPKCTNGVPLYIRYMAKDPISYWASEWMLRGLIGKSVSWGRVLRLLSRGKHYIGGRDSPLPFSANTLGVSRIVGELHVVGAKWSVLKSVHALYSEYLEDLSTAGPVDGNYSTQSIQSTYTPSSGESGGGMIHSSSRDSLCDYGVDSFRWSTSRESTDSSTSALDDVMELDMASISELECA